MANSSRVPVCPTVHKLQKTPLFPQAPLTALLGEFPSLTLLQLAGGTFSLACLLQPLEVSIALKDTLRLNAEGDRGELLSLGRGGEGEASVSQGFRKHCFSFKYLFLYFWLCQVLVVACETSSPSRTPALSVEPSHWAIWDVPGALFLVDTGGLSRLFNVYRLRVRTIFPNKTHTYNFQINQSNDDICVSSASRYGTINPIQCYKHNLVTIAEIHYFSSF